MYKGVVEYIKTQLETEFDNVYVGEQDWQNIFKIGKPIVEILPTTATRAPEGMSGIGNEEWEIQINVATKGMSMDSEEMEIDNLEHMMTVVDLFKSDSTSVDGYPVRFRVMGYDASRILLDKEDGQGYYVTACAVTTNAKITR